MQPVDHSRATAVCHHWASCKNVPRYPEATNYMVLQTYVECVYFYLKYEILLLLLSIICRPTCSVLE